MRPAYRAVLIGTATVVATVIACRDVINPTARDRRRADIGDTTPGDTVPGDTLPVDTLPADTTRPDTGGVVLTPLCGTNFSVLNARDTAVLVSYTVGEAAHRDTLRLPPRPSDTTYSETYLTTATAGVVRLFIDTLRVQQADPSGTACPERAKIGEWAPPFDWPIIPVHAHLLPDGTLLAFGRHGDPYHFDAATNVFTPVPTGTHVFCSGHSFLADGRLLVAGGHVRNYIGLRDANIFDPVTRSWTRVADMAYARWYPTSTTLANGEVLSISGTDANGARVGIPEVWQANGAWRRLTSAYRELPYYPRTFAAPSGRVFMAGPWRASRYLSTAGRGAWYSGPVMKYGYDRDYGSAVMYDAGRILIMGGGGGGGTGSAATRLPSATAEVLNLNSAAPTWSYTGPMANRRRQLNATVVPTGEVIVTGGTSGTGFSNEAFPVYAAEAWSPATGRWRTLARNAVMRVYHSTTLLLPDGRLLSAGGGDSDSNQTLTNEPNGEYFSPPYLFRADGALAHRPTITAVQPVVHYGERFAVITPDGGSIRAARWIRLGSVTHAYDENQRANTLVVEPAAGGVQVTAPASANLAPPGHYLLFLLDHNGVPSVGRIVQVVR